ncbi:MAG TPA: condensation domain-containing protein, partial [Polyangiales bacterium]|nr:condensation domain-containing protein [Polyangiales bacterium]
MSSPVRASVPLDPPPSDPTTPIAPYSLSPMQGGMLFQYLLSDGAERAGYDVEQIRIELNETLEAALLSRAFSHVARRHPILSTAFRWEGVERPEQRPFADVTVPVETIDWQRAGEELSTVRDEFLARDRRRSFDLRRAPLMRVTLCSLGSGRSELFWTFHHILLDGRSFATVLT